MFSRKEGSVVPLSQYPLRGPMVLPVKRSDKNFLWRLVWEGRSPRTYTSTGIRPGTRRLSIVFWTGRDGSSADTSSARTSSMASASVQVLL